MDGPNEPALPEPHRRLHRALIDALLAAGAVPGLADLARGLGVASEDVRAGLRALAAADYLALDAAGRLTCLYPFSLIPTPHVVVIGEERRYAMCALDALGIAAMMGREIKVEGRCAACEQPLHLRVRPDASVVVVPPATVVVARREQGAPACEVCCPFTVFACGAEHARALVARVLGTEMLPLDTALTLAAAIFGDLLGDSLPARRRRSTDVAVAQRSTSTS